MDSLFPTAVPLPAIDTLIGLRTPAPADWLAARRRPGLSRRAALVATCRAELDWALTDGRSVAVRLGLADEPAADVRLPHEQAAARLLNAWGHLHPTEASIHRLIGRLRPQRAAAAHDADWARRARGTLDDLQWYCRERRRASAAFFAAAADYAAVRRGRIRAAA